MAKARDAFRTISEVSDALDTPAHVLRFWESKFTQIKPVKRAGGRRYYRPDDMALLAGIKKLLHEQGMTIKGAQKLLRDQGVKHVMGLGAETVDEVVEATAITAQDAIADAIPGTIHSAEVPADEARGDESVVDEAQAAQDALAPGAADDPAPVAADTTSNITPLPQVTQQPEAKPATPDDIGAPTPTSTPATPKPADTIPQFMREISAQPAPTPVADAPAMVRMPPLPNITASPAIAEPQDHAPRIFHALYRANPARIRANAAQIAPLIAQLETLHTKMQHR